MVHREIKNGETSSGGLSRPHADHRRRVGKVACPRSRHNLKHRVIAPPRRVRVKFLDPDGLAECLTTEGYLPGRIDAVFDIAASECWALTLDKAISWPNGYQENRSRDFLLKLVAYIAHSVASRRIPEARPDERVAEMQILACPHGKTPGTIQTLSECTFVSGGFVIIEP